MKKLTNKIKENKIEFIILLIILLLACFLRFYNLGDYLHFAHDEGRDAFVINDIIEKGEIPLIGPEASMGHFHLGPLYYYLIFPFFILFGLKPVGGAFIVALFGLVSVFFIWRLSRRFFSKKAGIITALLYSISFVVILHSRWSWNLNPMPFFVILYIYSFWKLINSKDNRKWWFFLWVLTIGIMPNLHASAFLFVPISIILLLVYKIKKLNWKSYFLGAITLIILNVPLLIYEFYNKFENTRKIKDMLLDSSGGISFMEKVWHNLINLCDLMNALVFANFHGLDFNLLFSNFRSTGVSVFSLLPGYLLLAFLIIFSVFYSIKYKKNKSFRLVAFVALMLFPGFIFFKQILYLHYYIILFPIIFIILGFALSYFYKKNLISKIISIIFIILVVFSNLFYLFSYWSSISRGTWQNSYSIPYFQMEKAADYIVNISENGRINIVCEVEGHCIAFQYIFKLKNIELDQNAPESYKIFKNRNVDSRFGPIEVEKIE